jgi:Spy/CpxP family protein refolding chaperone
MLGFVFGALCLGGLVALFYTRPRGFHRWGACHGRRGYGRHGLYAALERLDTTPGQEKVIVSAIGDLKDSAGETRAKLQASRREIGAAIRADSLDHTALEDLMARHVTDLTELGSRAVHAIGRIHEVLDPEQRARLARMIEHGPGWGFAGGR